MTQENTITLEYPKPRNAWDALSMKEKAEMIGVAVRNGITNLNDIRDRYNEFAEGGSVDTDWSYDSWKKQIAKHMGIRPDEDNTYDYEAYFKKYPEEAWKMLKGDPTAHFSDEFKTVYHPTFSSKSIGNDGSIYSGVRNPKTNPQGLVGGTWSPDYHTFTMSPDGYRGPVSMDDRKWYLENAEDNGVQLREANGSLPIYDGIPWGGVLPNVTIYGSKHSLGGPLVEDTINEYKKGGSIHISPSKKGTFTAAAKKHGKSVQAFASQVLAHPENYSPAMRKKANFARNARKWKHGLGGNLFDGTSQPTQKMQIGLDVQGWPDYTTQQIIAYGKENERKRKAIQDAYLNFVTESNDATAVANGRPQNQHLVDKAVQGAKANAAWEKEHPTLNTWGNVLSAVPFAVAAAPAGAWGLAGVSALGDAAAATSVGQAITVGLAPLATAASTSVAGAPLYTWADIGLSSLFGGHGVQTAIDEGGVSPMTALEIAPLGRLTRPIYNAVKPKANFVPTIESNMAGIRYAYKRNPELANIGFRKFMSSPRITAENATSVAPEQWTAAQDAAIARGDMTEAQRLRDLHFKVSAPNSVTYEVFHHGNKKPMDWYTFDPERIGTTDEGYSGAGYYFAPTRPASQYAKEHLPHTLGPHGEQNAGLSGGRYHRYVYLNGETKYKPLGDHDWTTHTDLPFVDNRPIEVVVGDNKQIKLADAITYDDKGVRIPLGKRDNFSINDIRYGLLPFGIGLTGYGLFNNQEALGGKIKKK